MAMLDRARRIAFILELGRRELAAKQREAKLAG